MDNIKIGPYSKSLLEAEGNIVYLIEKVYLDPLENNSSEALKYKPFGFKYTEEEAVEFCKKSKIYTKKNCWAINGSLPEFVYLKLNEIIDTINF